ncbi:MAG TPA: ORF6N domain-containing protein [Sedimentisphaerales bacterium]|nr:ORF6N domain-containing protein [Sedimentisphaerales bacterium]
MANLYEVPTKRLNEQVKRNCDRFPPDFMFRLTSEEAELLRSQFATSKRGRGGRRYTPYAFTEHGAIMAASVLNSKRAIQTSILVVRAFVRLRQMLAPYKDLVAELARHEKRLQAHDKQIVAVIQAIKLLMPPPDDKPKEPFGFHPKKKRN